MSKLEIQGATLTTEGGRVHVYVEQVVIADAEIFNSGAALDLIRDGTEVVIHMLPISAAPLL